MAKHKIKNQTNCSADNLDKPLKDSPDHLVGIEFGWYQYKPINKGIKEIRKKAR